MKARHTLLWAAALILTGCAGKAALPPIMASPPEPKLLGITQPEGEAHYVFCAACPDRTPKRLALAPAPVSACRTTGVLLLFPRNMPPRDPPNP